MFNGKYIEWNRKRSKAIVDFYGHKFLYMKKILDLGCGHGDIGGSFQRLGAEVTLVDAREEHLKVAAKKYPGSKTIKADLDGTFPILNKKFDIVISLDLLCHLKDYEKHLKQICSVTTHLVLETAVCDSTDDGKCIYVPENSGIYDLSLNGMGARPSAAAIERILDECGMDFRRIDDAKLNSMDYVYDWKETNSDSTELKNRRFWFAKKKDSIYKFAIPTPKQTSPAPIVAAQLDGRYERAGIRPNQTNNVVKKLTNNKRFVIVIPSYNNSKYCEKNIQTSLDQDYEDFRIIFTDDCSSDDTFNKVSKIVNEHKNKNKCTLIKNKTRVGALENLYNMIHSCKDDEIILTLDGDDWFPNNNVLNRLNYHYTSEDIWMSYGQYTNHPMGGKGVANPYPKHVIDSNSFRSYQWGASHLRTFYSWLFKKIKKEDLMYEGKFLSMTWDFAIMFPMMEMSGYHQKYIDETLYVYNLENPINDHKVNQKLQQRLDVLLRSKEKYQRVSKPNNKVGLMIIATNKYDKFIQGLISSADRYFLKSSDVTYYLFTDSDKKIKSSRQIKTIKIDHKPFPFATMDRFMHFSNNAENLKNEDYLFYVDVDCLFVDIIDESILGNLVGVQHCGYVGQKGPVEKNNNSAAYVSESNPNKYKTYFGGGFSGGRTDKYLKLSKQCDIWKDQDMLNNIMPIWHDETLINKYFAENYPDIVLSPSYHYPQGNINYYKTIWKEKYKPKILLLDKNHEEIRK